MLKRLDIRSLELGKFMYSYKHSLVPIRFFKRSIKLRPRFGKSLILRIPSLLGYFKTTNAFLVYFITFNHETVHDKWC